MTGPRELIHLVRESFIGGCRLQRGPLTIPVLGSGHGGMPWSIALLFNILAVRSITTEDLGLHLRNVRIVVFEGDADDLAVATTQDHLARDPA